MLPEVLEEKLVEKFYDDALAEKEVAQIVAQHYKGSFDRIFAMAQDELESEGVPVETHLLKIRFWGDRAIDIKPSTLWNLIPLTFKDGVALLSTSIMALWFLNLALDAIESQPVQVSQVQAQVQEVR